MRPSRRRFIPALLVVLVACAPGAADEARFVSLKPAGPPGAWVAELATKGVKNPGALAFWADGARLAASPEPGQGGLVRVRLEGVPAGASRIEAGIVEKGGPAPLAALRVGASDPKTAPFDDWIVYHVMMGMFANGSVANDGQIQGWKHPSYAGGDLQGVLAHAAHLQELGANAVWLSPIFAARSSHGYDVTDYYRIGDAVAVPGDPAASLALFRQLVADLRGRGIRVILDVPLNHASGAYDRAAGDPSGAKPRATGARQTAEKVWEGWNSGYRYWDFDHEPTRRFLKEVALHWLVKEGVDGLRLDYVRGVPHDFWAELRAAVESAKPEALLVGEAWTDDQGAEANARDIATWYAPVGGAPQLESMLEFPAQIAMTNVFARGGAATELEEVLQESQALYGPGATPMYFLDNHDLARFMAWTDDPRRLTAAIGFMASLSGPIVLFYGTETGLAHGAPKSGFTDAGRIPMPWAKLDEKLVAEVRGILQVRRRHPALSRGGRLPLATGKDLLVMAKVAGEETAIVGVNLSGTARDVEVDLGGLLPAGTKLAPALGDAPATVGEGGRLTWRLPPMATAVVVAAP